MQLGAKHVESPFIEFGQISTVLYFLYFTVIMYSITFIENSFVELNLIENLRITDLTKNHVIYTAYFAIVFFCYCYYFNYYKLIVSLSKMWRCRI